MDHSTSLMRNSDTKSWLTCQANKSPRASQVFHTPVDSELMWEVSNRMGAQEESTNELIGKNQSLALLQTAEARYKKETAPADQT